MYPIVVSGDSILGAKVSGFAFWRFNFGSESFWFCFLAIHFGSEGFCFDIWGFPSGTAFHLGFWKSMRSMVMLRGAWSE